MEPVEVLQNTPNAFRINNHSEYCRKDLATYYLTVVEASLQRL